MCRRNVRFDTYSEFIIAFVARVSARYIAPVVFLRVLVTRYQRERGWKERMQKDTFRAVTRYARHVRRDAYIYYIHIHTHEVFDGW